MRNNIIYNDRLVGDVDNLTDTQILLLDTLYDELEMAQKQLYDRLKLFIGVYLTEVQGRRWVLWSELGSIKAVAKREKVSTAAISKSLLGTRDNEPSKSRIKSPEEKLGQIILADVKIQDALIKIKSLNNEINEIIGDSI